MQAHKLLHMLLDLKHNSPALPRILSWFLGSGGRLTPALRHSKAPPPSVDLEDEGATREAIGMLPLVELVQLRQFLLQQVGRRFETVPAVHQNARNQEDGMLARWMVIEKKHEQVANGSRSGKEGANSKESTFVRLSHRAYRAFCYDFHEYLVSGALPLDRSKGPLRASLADAPPVGEEEVDVHSLLSPNPDIPFIEDGSELAEHAVFDRLLYHNHQVGMQYTTGCCAVSFR
ncbi:hypothetical protein DUNSADRAFT_2241 [Dunaliella salina]|uniref:Uncharacterized protein n=1 Tax=Dunaliella salina TaxID=3046 RepID=A0ABQ7GVY3_DUNSA|nr:hypothetical protein DUNSADRAFT_2241 [Dunaliella salina]|eukprot:KAF5838778.1 hypothetical protein DUNSADRAFT_2241 [Dunaliella salina]